jgi:hypothetical protein
MKTLPELIRSLHRRQPFLSLYSGEELVLSRDDFYSLSLISSLADEENLLPEREYLVLQGSLYLRTGERVRGYHKQSVPVMSISQGDTVYLELGK